MIRQARLGIIGVILLIGAGVVFNSFDRFPVLFPDLVGPAQNTVLPVLPPDPGFSNFQAGDENALALLVNDLDSSWRGLASGLKSIGVPFKVMTQAEQALNHNVIMIYPSLTGANTAPENLRAFADHVRNGGTLMAFSVIGGGMPDLFGFADSQETRQLQEIRFTDIDFNRSFAATAAESTFVLGNSANPDSGLSGIRYIETKHEPIARFNDGTAALTYNFFNSENGTGHAYAFGIDLGHFILRATNGRFVDLAETYVNDYQPKIDTFLRFIAKVYQQGEPNAVLFSPTPEGKDFTALVTHDIDFVTSLANTAAYAELQKNSGIAATYFIQTKYITDFNEEYFFTPEQSSILYELVTAGMEIGSHSVAHSRVFNQLPIGTGDERYPEYTPFVESLTETRNATVAGELRVSKYLLEQVSGQEIISFRPGHLVLPASLPQMLEATGYLYSSSITANQALTHLPFLTMYDRSYDRATSVYEFPVTIEDESGILGNRIDEAISVARKIAQYRGLVNLLIHTDILGHKFEFTSRFINEFRDTAWFGTMKEYGQWWHARNDVSLEITETSPSEIQVRVINSLPISGLSLELPEGWRYRSGVQGSQQTGNLLTLGTMQGNAGNVLIIARDI